MQREPESATVHALGQQVIVQRIAVLDENIDPLRRLTRRQVEARELNPGQSIEPFAVARIDSLHTFDAAGKKVELSQPDCRLKIRELEVVTDDGMRIVAARSLHGSPLILEFAQPAMQGCIAVGFSWAVLLHIILNSPL